MNFPKGKEIKVSVLLFKNGDRVEKPYIVCTVVQTVEAGYVSLSERDSVKLRDVRPETETLKL